MERETSSSSPHPARPSLERDGLYLLLAMAPTEEVIQYFEEEKECLRQQDAFADAVNTAWKDEHGPSKSYLRHVCKQYISLIGEHNVESDALLAVLLQMLTACSKSDLPDPKECCHLSYPIRQPRRQPPPMDCEPLRLRLRVYPHHNDVSLRLWEAGAALAEYVHTHPSLVRGRHVVELGAGVGLTGLVCLTCGAARMTCTDYTQLALDNLQFNYSLFRNEWERKSFESVTPFGGEFEALYLDWDDTGGGAHGDGQGTASQHGLAAVADATVLLAADVVYDVTVIPSLVRLLRFFLESPPDTDGESTTPRPPRTALLAATVRNRESLARLLQLLAAHGIAARTLVAASSPPSSSLDADLGAAGPRLVATRFVQPRSDVHIYALEMPLDRSLAEATDRESGSGHYSCV